MVEKPIVIAGAGMGGLAAAVALSAAGRKVLVVEPLSHAGGKIRTLEPGGRPVDSGPTVLTMRWVFERIFADAGAALAEHVTLVRAARLARHAWPDGGRLDLHADLEQSAEAIGRFAGAKEAEGFLGFSARAKAVYETLRESFIAGERAGPVALSTRVGLTRIAELTRMAPFSTLSRLLEGYFADPRLRQLFGRYATYCGSSPFLAPATLMLVAHAEREGVWLVSGGMSRIAAAFRDLALARGAEFRFGHRVEKIIARGGRAAAVVTDDGAEVEAAAVIWNGDVNALADGSLGPEASRSVAGTAPRDRSLSALTFAMSARTEGFPLLRHTVFFSRDSGAEFDDIFRRGALPTAPTVYVCAQDRDGSDGASPSGAERLFLIVNAPARARTHPLTEAEIAACQTATFLTLKQSGLAITPEPDAMIRTAPEDFARLFPSTQGALYGRATHGWNAAFSREGARSRLPGLYLAGGSVHPGPGVPMAALSGRQAALAVMRDLASTSPSRRAATHGGTSMR